MSNYVFMYILYSRERRILQLRVHEQYEREYTAKRDKMLANQRRRNGGKNRGVRFILSVMLLEAAARNDIEEGTLRHLSHSVSNLAAGRRESISHTAVFLSDKHVCPVSWVHLGCSIDDAKCLASHCVTTHPLSGDAKHAICAAREGCAWSMATPDWTN